MLFFIKIFSSKSNVINDIIINDYKRHVLFAFILNYLIYYVFKHRI